jgi:hypothetical protein
MVSSVLTKSFVLVSSICIWASVSLAADESTRFDMSPQFISPGKGQPTIGGAHGDIAVSSTGEIYVSVEEGSRPGIQVFSPSGEYLRNVLDAPTDLHGFVIGQSQAGEPCIFGARLKAQEIVQITLAGKRVLTIPAAAIPEKYRKPGDVGRLTVGLTAVAVAPNGDIYGVDGYGLDYIHRFDSVGRYKQTFGGREEPWNFKQCHKIAVDSRFNPPRLLCTDRLHGRVIQMTLDGLVIGTLANGLRWPSALAIFKEELAVAELGGRVSILDKQGELISQIGANDNVEQTTTNDVPPEKWVSTKFYSPHGVAYDAVGNLLVTEWNRWGRVVRVERK